MSLRASATAGIAAALVVAVIATGCAGASRTVERPTRAEQARAAFEKVADQRGVVLADVERPAPPRGYDTSDVDTAVRQAVGILDTSADPALSGMTPDDAVDEVLSNQYDESREGILELVRETFGGTRWQWALASRFDPDVTPRSFVIEASAQAVLERDGGDRWLSVGVRAHFLHRLTGPAGERFVVSRRQIEINTDDISAGPESPPWLGFGAQVFGVEVCELDTSVLTPTEDAETLASDATTLRRSLTSPIRPIAVDDDDDAAEFRERLAACEA